MNENPDDVKLGKGQRIIVYNEDSGLYEKSEYIPISMQPDSVEDIGYVFSYYNGYMEPEKVSYGKYYVNVFCEEFRVTVLEPGTGRIISEDSIEASTPFVISYYGSPPSTYHSDLSKNAKVELMQKLCEEVGIEWVY